MRLTPDTIRAAVARHETGWFDMYLNPIVPQVGQRFSEVEIGEADEGNATSMRRVGWSTADSSSARPTTALAGSPRRVRWSGTPARPARPAARS